MIQIEQKTHTGTDGNNIIVLTPAGRLDITTAWQFRLKLQECISKITPNLVVNLSQVNFIDSSGLTSLVAGMRDADKAKGSFRICNVHPEAKLVFEVTMMDSVFAIFETEEEALEGVTSGAVS
ncbi:MAG: STAS domain-containing protein [Calothrix sp. MO_167.B12]|nr:STAS domain-containing protein [Calothrix sp. MO_167.B12]